MADPVVKTQEFVTDLLKRLSDQIDAIAEFDTQEKKNAAHEKLGKAFSTELRQKSLVFRFTIQDIVAENDGVTAELKLSDPEGTDGLDSVLDEIVLPIRKADANKINSGDVLILSGKSLLEIGTYRQGKNNRGGFGGGGFGGELRDQYTHARIGAFWSSVAKHEYTICLSDLKFRTEHKK